MASNTGFWRLVIVPTHTNNCASTSNIVKYVPNSRGQKVEGCWGLTPDGGPMCLVTLPGGSMCFIDIPRGLYVLYVLY